MEKQNWSPLKKIVGGKVIDFAFVILRKKYLINLKLPWKF